MEVQGERDQARPVVSLASLDGLQVHVLVAALIWQVVGTLAVSGLYQPILILQASG